jgi:hypothetical protein
MNPPDAIRYRLKIDILNVDSLPMARLAEYLAEFAALLGERECVHFSHLERGSAVLVSSIDPVAFDKVVDRVTKVRQGDGPKNAMQAYWKLDTLLAKDDAVAELLAPGNSLVMAFPGRTRPKPIRYGPFREDGSLDGRIIRIGGRDDTIPVWLKNGDIEYHSNVHGEDVARRLAPFYLNGIVRLHGSGKWLRDENDSWILQQFEISDFDVLDDSPLIDVVGKLRTIEGGEWSAGDSLADILGTRRQPRDRH